MQLRRWFTDVMREEVTVEFECFTQDGMDPPIKRIGTPFMVAENQKNPGEMYVRIWVTHEENDKGEVVKLAEGKPRTATLFKILEDSHKRRKDLEYIKAPYDREGKKIRDMH